MEIELKKDFNNKLLDRREITLSVTYTGKTPSKEDLKQEACKKLSLNPELSVIIKIDALFGMSASEVTMHSYGSKEAMNSEQKYLFERLVKKEKKGAAAQAAAPAPVPAPQEKKAEEAKK